MVIEIDGYCSGFGQNPLAHSADAGQLLADLDGDDAIGAHGGARDQHALVFGGDVADARGVAAERMGAQNLQSTRSAASGATKKTALPSLAT